MTTDKVGASERAVAADAAEPVVSALRASIPDAVDADCLDIIEALVSDACAAESPRGVHEGGEYYAERIVRRAIEQGTLALAVPPAGHAAEGEGYPLTRALRSMRHVLSHNLELFSNSRGYITQDKTDGYLAAKVPDWLLRQWIAALTAQAIEARRAETGTGSVHESAVGESQCAQTPSGDNA